MGVRCSNASFAKNPFYSFELRVQTRNLDYFFLASKFDACGDAGELFKDFSYFFLIIIIIVKCTVTG